MLDFQTVKISHTLAINSAYLDSLVCSSSQLSNNGPHSCENIEKNQKYFESKYKHEHRFDERLSCVQLSCPSSDAEIGQMSSVCRTVVHLTTGDAKPYYSKPNDYLSPLCMI